MGKRQFIKEDILVITKGMKIYSGSLLGKSNRNIEILSFLAITLANDKKINDTDYCHGCGETGGLMHG